MTTFVIDGTSVGSTIGSPDGAVTALSMTTPPQFETPCFDEGQQHWVSGYFVLRGSADIHDLVSIQPTTTGGAGGAGVVVNGGLDYAGELQVVAVPRGSTWSITLSDDAASRVPPAPSGKVGLHPAASRR